MIFYQNVRLIKIRTWFTLGNAAEMSQHESVLADRVECFHALYVVPASNDCMQKLAIADQGNTLAWVLAQFMETAQVLK